MSGRVVLCCCHDGRLYHFHEYRSGLIPVIEPRTSYGAIDIIYPILRFKHNSLNDYNGGGGTESPDLLPPLLGEDV